jgi:peptidyl-prolyl cis-trans isomerase C
MKLKTPAVVLGTLVLPLAVMAQNIATVNGKAVPKSRVDTLVKNAMHGQDTPPPPELMQQAKDQVVLREIFAQEAEKQGVAKSPEYQANMDLARQSILISQLFEQYKKTHPVSDAEAKAEYEKVKAAQSGNEYHARHILVDNEDEAKKLIAQIKGGAKFDELAKKNSKDTGSAENGGDLDWSKPNAYVPEFAAALEKLKPGEMTETPVKTQFGYHIIKLEEVRPAQFPSYDEVKDKLKAQMEQVKVQEYQEKLRKAAKTDYKFAADQPPAPPAAPAKAAAPAPAPAASK